MSQPSHLRLVTHQDAPSLSVSGGLRRVGTIFPVIRGGGTDDEPLGAVLGEYAERLRAAGNRPTTIKARLSGVSLLGQAAGKDPRWAATTDLTRWLAGEDLSAWSRNTYYGHARAWFDFLLDTGRRTDDPTRRLKRPTPPRGVPRPITADQLADLLAISHDRTRTFVLLGAYAGLRVHEIAKIRGEDVSVSGIRVKGKGGHEAVVPTHPLIWAEAAQYPRPGWWFPSHARAGHIQPDSVSTAVRRAMLTAGVDGHSHQLRHFFGTEVLRASGGNIRVAQELLRHASPRTTALYTLVDDEETRAAVLALPGA